MTSALTTSRIVLLLIVRLPCVFCPWMTPRMPLPIAEPESFVPWVPILFPSIFPTMKGLDGPVAAPAAVATLIAWLRLPVIVVLLRIWKAMFETSDWLKSSAMLLFVNELPLTVKLLEAAGAVIAPPDEEPIRPVLLVTTWIPVALTPEKVEFVTEPLSSTDVPRIATSSASLPVDPEGWQALPVWHWIVVFDRLNAVTLVLVLSRTTPLCGALVITSFATV